jgi:hypothetical protein
VQLAQQLMTKELCIRAFLPITGRFVTVNGSVSGIIGDTFGDSAGEFWTVLRHLTKVMMPHRPKSVGPMLPNIGTATEA